MATCKECVHYEACGCYNGATKYYMLDVCVDNVEKICRNFKDKNSYAKVKHSKWIKTNNQRTCPVCDFNYHSNNDDFNYCPSCGAKWTVATVIDVVASIILYICAIGIVVHIILFKGG